MSKKDEESVVREKKPKPVTLEELAKRVEHLEQRTGFKHQPEADE